MKLVKQAATSLEILCKTLSKQRYHLIGSHSAVKKCEWLHKALTKGQPCYKERFYGIKSHRCIQMTPTVIFCNFRCLYCWRVQPEDIGMHWNQFSPLKWDDPELIVEKSIIEQRRILSGYKDWVLKGKMNPKKLEEAKNPNQAAISLSGEPTLYPYLSELIELYSKKGFTTFLVTNGSRPEAISELSTLPTQLYITVSANSEEMLNRVARPMVRDAWRRLNEALEIMSTLKTRTVIRLTLVRGLNLREPEKYAKLISKAEPMFIEPKGYMHVGFSQKRLSKDNMPTHSEIRKFSEKLAQELGYYILDESPVSRVALLSKKRTGRWIQVD